MSSVEQKSGSPPAPPGGDREGARPLRLSDFLDLATLQEIQDGFVAVTRLRTTIRDADGRELTAPTDAGRSAASERVLDQLIGPGEIEGDLVAPITVEGRHLGSITIEPRPPDTGDGADEAGSPGMLASIQFLNLLSNAIARLCYDEHNAKQRAQELSVLYEISSALSGQRDLQRLLDKSVRSIAELMGVRAASIRLLKEADGSADLVPRAVHNLSPAYLTKGTVRLDTSDMFQEAIAGHAVTVDDMAEDPRMLFPGDARREGLVSMLCVGIVFQGIAIGTIQLFTSTRRYFTELEIRLLRAIAQLIGAAIQNARLDEHRTESRRLVRQLRLAADVQRRMLPRAEPQVPPFDIAARYVPSMELAGDFYDFIPLQNHLGVAIGDVVGKGVAASLQMASVRASLRAFAQDLYDLDEVIARVNVALSRDTLDNEFATLWYGVLDPQKLRLTYCNAGHDPPILMRGDRLHNLDTGGMILGVDGTQHYDKGIWHLKPGDTILLYTDGLPDAMNDQDRKFGRPRVEATLREAAGRSAGDVLRHLLHEMRSFTGSRPGTDDTTLVAIKVNA